MLRASGVNWDLRRNEPYMFYDDVEFDVPVYPNGDVYDRYRVHMDEMRESVRIVRQCLDMLDATDGEPWIADDRKVVLPPRHELHGDAVEDGGGTVGHHQVARVELGHGPRV